MIRKEEEKEKKEDQPEPKEDKHMLTFHRRVCILFHLFLSIREVRQVRVISGPQGHTP